MDSIKINTFTEYRFVSTPSFSPDGSCIAFLVQQADLKDNHYKGDLYLYNCKSEQISRLTSSQDVKQYTWTAGKNLIFSSDREKKKKGVTSYYEISPVGGEAKKAFEIPLQAQSIHLVKEDYYLISGVYMPEKALKDQNDAYEVIDEIPFWFNGKGFINGQRNRLYLYHAATKELKSVSEEDAECGSFSIRKDKILYKAHPWQGVRGQYEGIYLYDISTGENRCILKKNQMRIGMISFWSENQALVAASDGKSPYGNGKYPDFYTLNLSDGELKPLIPYDYGSGAATVGTDSRLLGGTTVKTEEGVCYFLTTRGHNSHLYSVSQEGTLKAETNEEGACDSFDVKNGHTVVCALYENKLAELYLDGKQITQMNDMSRWSISAPEPLTFTASDGFELTGWVMKPVGYRQGEKYPAILNIHGGPRTVFGTVFHHEMQVWANAGYFVFYTNPRGSDGFGTEFGDINGKYGTVDYENLMEFTDLVISSEPDIDPKRLAVAGGSYGGFMTNWIIGHTDRFAAAVSQRSIANWISFEYMSDIGHTFTKDNQSVFACEDVEKLWFHSPVKYAASCTTPTLFVHSDQDYRCNFSEGLQMFSALKILGTETRMCVLRGENHELSRSGRPRNRVVRMKEILDWLDGHLKQEKCGKEER